MVLKKNLVRTKCICFYIHYFDGVLRKFGERKPDVLFLWKIVHLYAWKGDHWK